MKSSIIQFNIIYKYLFTITSIIVLIPLFSQTPAIDWQYSYWSSQHPDNGNYIPQNESGEDWFFDHKISLDKIKPESNGYICAGYSTIVEWAAEENNGCYSNNPLGCPKCHDFESYGNRRGSNLSVMSLVGLDGVSKWYHTYNEGWFYKVIQTSDGGYLGIGPTFSTEKPNGNPLIYNPNQGGNISNTFLNGISCIKGSAKRKACLVKTDKNGIVQWQYIYGMEPFTGNGTSAYSSGVMGWDVVETPDGSFRFTGCAEDPNHNDLMRTFVIEIDNDGFWQWGKYYGSTNYFSVGIKIEKYNNGTTTKYIIAGEEKFMTNNHNKRVFAFQMENPNDPFTDWVYISSGITSLGSRVSDFIINDKNELLLPIGVNCNGCFSASGEATGKLFKIDTNTGFPIGTPTFPINLGVLKAFDLKIGITPTADGGFAIASTKQVNGVPTLQINSPQCPLDPLCVPNPPGPPESHNYDFEYWDTDGYAAKYTSTGILEWDKTFDANSVSPGPLGSENTWPYPDPYMRDLKRQECLYSIVQSPDGGFVIGGNNSSNFDDSYLTKLESTCKDLLLDGIIESGSISYTYSNTITAQNYEITNNGGNVVFVAGNSIHLKDGFKANNGCFFHAYIDTGIDCTPNYKSLSDDYVDLAEINNFQILNSKKLINADPRSIIERTNLENRSMEEKNKISISNYPNPFSNNTIIEFNIAKVSEVSLSVYNSTGSLVSNLINNEFKYLGKHSILFEGGDFNPGIYIYKLQVGSEMLTGRMVLINH